MSNVAQQTIGTTYFHKGDIFIMDGKWHYVEAYAEPGDTIRLGRMWPWTRLMYQWFPKTIGKRTVIRLMP